MVILHFILVLICTAVHGLTVARNVAYRTRGHMYFLEDGNESNNYIAHNLGMVAFKVTDAAKRVEPTDTQPAIFWITNPGNKFEGNHAVASPQHCIWYGLL